MNKYFTGIGSRETPTQIGYLMTHIARYLEKQGYILRSGGATGADSFFFNGVKDPKNKEIYLPWKGFNNSDSELYLGNIGKEDEAEANATRIHFNFAKLSQGAKKLHTRNMFQCGLKGFSDFSKFVICWTKNGEEKGGTRTAIVYAKENNIPIYNLYDIKQCYKFMSKIGLPRLYYNEMIEVLNPNEVFVFGSNPEWRHGKGAAKIANEKFGAKHGEGPVSGQCYGIITKNLKLNFADKNGKIYEKHGEKSISLEEISQNVNDFYDYANRNLDKWFLVAYDFSNDANLNGYSGSEMKSVFNTNTSPKNVVFHKSFLQKT